MKKTICRYGKSFSLRELDRDIQWRVRVAAEQERLSQRMAGQRETVAACPICGEKSSRMYVEVFSYPYRQCEGCDHIYLSTPVSDSATADLYGGQGDAQSVQGIIYLAPGVFEKRLHAIAVPKVEFVMEVLKTLDRTVQRRWIDIGCGAGEILVAARTRGWSVLGLESDAAEAESARQHGVEVAEVYLSPDNADDYLQAAGVISLFNVLEHVKSPGNLLQVLAKHLEEGVLVFEVPRHPSLSSLSCQLFPEMACRHIYPPDHLHVFTEKSVDILLEGCGLELLAVWHYGQDYSDLLHSAAASRHVTDVDLWWRAVELQDQVQAVLDRHGLNDCMILVCSRRR